MKRIKILNRKGVQTHGAEMEDPSTWLAEGIAKNWWGKAERWVTALEEDVSAALETKTETDPLTGETKKLYRLPAEYTITIEDTAAEIAEREAKKAARKQRVASLEAFVGKDLTAAESREAIKLMLADYMERVKQWGE